MTNALLWLKRHAFWLAALVVLGAAGAAWSLRSIAVPAIHAQQGPLLRTLQVTARVATLSRVEVGATLTGRVQAVLVNEGDTVQAGQVLVQLEAQELQAAWQQAQANEQQARARVQGLRSTGRSAAQAAVAQATAQVVAAQAELKRSKELVAQGFVSASQLDDRQRALDVALAQQSSAQAQWQAQGDNGTDMQQAQAQVAVAQAATAAAKARLDQVLVRSPADAKVLLRAVEPGQIVQPGKALLNLALAGPTQLVAQMDERFLDQLRLGQAATVVADAYATQRMAAKVIFIAPGVDAQRGAVQVKLALTEPAPVFLREDMTLSVEVETGRRDKAWVLPLAALRTVDARDASQATVWVARAGRVEVQSVQLGLRSLAAVEVTQGLEASDAVLLGGKVQPGARVTPQIQAASLQGANAVGAVPVTSTETDAGVSSQAPPLKAGER